MGKKIPEKDRQALIELVREEIAKYKAKEIQRLSSNQELADIVGCKKWALCQYLKDLDTDERKFRSNAILKDNISRRNELNGSSFLRLSKEQLRAQGHKTQALYGCFLARISHEQRVETGKKYGPLGGKRAIELYGYPGKNLTTEQRRQNGRKGGALGGKIGGPIGGKISGIKAAENFRKNSYNPENRFYSSSQQEGAVALLLERYLSGYRINDGTNYQVKNNGINNGGIDFLVDREFLEWHPFILTQGKRSDIPSKEEHTSYKKVLEQLTNEERKEFQTDYENVLALNYRNARQASVDNSGYKGTNVALATNPQELYSFLQQHGAQLPSYENFKSEFNKAVKYVKTFKVQKQEKIKEAVA